MIRIFSILPVQLLNKMMTFRYTYVLTYLSIWLLYIILVRIHFREMQGTESRIKIMQVNFRLNVNWRREKCWSSFQKIHFHLQFNLYMIYAWVLLYHFNAMYYILCFESHQLYLLYSSTVLGQDAVVVVSHHNLSLKLETLEPKQII